MKFLFLFLAGWSASLLGQTPGVSSGTLQRFENFKSEYVAPRNVEVWLPEGYSKNKKYAVLYMHDGQMLFDSTTNWNKQEWGVDETVGRLLKNGEIKETIVVGVWNTGQTRHAEYFPKMPLQMLPKDVQDSILQYKPDKKTLLFVAPIQSDEYLKFLVTELKPFIDSHFSTRKGRKNTFIAGSSMGGLISLYAICEYPKVFGGAACLSTHWPGTFVADDNPLPAAFVRYADAHLPNPKKHRIYFDYGTATLDAWYEPSQRKVDQVMVQHGYSSKNWITRKFEGANHSEKAWRDRLEIPLVFLLH